MMPLVELMVAVGFLLGLELDSTHPFIVSKRCPTAWQPPSAQSRSTTAVHAMNNKPDGSGTDSKESVDNTSNEDPEKDVGAAAAAPRPRRTKEEEDALLGYAIDSFLRGDYNLQLPEDKMTSVSSSDASPGMIVSTALSSLRGQDLPSQAHGAAIFLRYCMPLRRSERWGDASSIGKDPWKEVLRGTLTANSLVQRVRASDFAALLDWSRMDVTEGAFTSDRDLVGLPSVAYVNAALFFEENSEPILFQFKLQRVVGSGTWMIDTIRRSQKELFLETNPERPRNV